MRANECPPATRRHEKERLREHARGTASRFCSRESVSESERALARERVCVRAHTHTLRGFGGGTDGRARRNVNKVQRTKET